MTKKQILEMITNETHEDTADRIMELYAGLDQKDADIAEANQIIESLMLKITEISNACG